MAEMTAVEYLKIKNRICENHKKKYMTCSGGECPLHKRVGNTINICRIVERENPEEAIEKAQKWAEEHPVKTILMDLLEKYPNANPNAIIMELCPDTLGYPKDGDICENGEYENRCQKCWNRPLEE